MKLQGIRHVKDHPDYFHDFLEFFGVDEEGIQYKAEINWVPVDEFVHSQDKVIVTNDYDIDRVLKELT